MSIRDRSTGNTALVRKRWAEDRSKVVPLPNLERVADPITEGQPITATHRREGIYRGLLALADTAVAMCVTLVALRMLAPDAGLLPALFGVPVMIFLNKTCGLYDRDDLVLKKTTLDEAPRLLEVAGLFVLAVWLLSNQSTVGQLPAGELVGLWAATLVLLLVARAGARRLARRLATTERCLVVGEHRSVGVIRSKLQSARINARVVGAIALDSTFEGTDHLEVHLTELVRELDVNRVIIAPTDWDAAETLDLVRVAKHAGVRVSVLPRLLEVVGSSVEFDHVDGLTMLGVRRFGLTRSSRALKRAFDVVGSSLLLVAVAPVMAAIAAAIRLDTHGPVLFRQTRVGRAGHRFQMLKFRSMVVGAEARKEGLRALNETQGLFKIENDPRVTRVGRFLRRTSLDELPQLVNVWRGEMSLVGPRPLVVDEDEQVQGLDRHRLHLTPGMTGHWQILGSARIPMDEMVGIDYLYVANWSLWTDVKILLRTVPYVLSSRGM